MSSAILYQNLADDGVVSASSWIAAAPPSVLQNTHVTRRWKGSNGAAEYILVTWSSAQSIDTIALFGCAVVDASVERVMSAAASSRIRVSSVDLTGLAGDLYDSGNVVGAIREEYGALVSLRPATLSARAVRIDLSESGVDAIVAGRIVIGLRSAFTLNFGYGWAIGYDDLSRIRKSAGGLSFVDRDDRYRVLNLTYESLDQADRYAHVHEIDRINGVSRDVLLMTNVDSTQLDRDSIWGLIQDMSPPMQPNLAYFSKSYRIEERR